MLVRLFGKNFRSLKDSFELSLVAAELTRAADRDRGVIEVPLAGMDEPLRLLRTVAIFGPNASGKSTVLMAGAALRWLAASSNARTEPDADIVPYEPFSLNEDSRDAPIELGCDVVCGKSLARYEVTFSKQEVLRETLTSIDGEGETVLIHRDPSGKVGGQLIERSDANRAYVDKMRLNVTALSKLAQHGPHEGRESVQPYYVAIREATRYTDYSTAGLAVHLGDPGSERFADDEAYRNWVMHHLVKPADMGICDVQVGREAAEIPGFVREMAKTDKNMRLPDQVVVVSFLHAGDTSRPIDFSHESSGTRKLFGIARDWWMLANKPVTLLADELAAGLHPRLVDRLIRSINDAPADRVRSQFIFTTHDAGLLESQDGQPPALRRDQVYFTKKDTSGASELYSLAEFKEGVRPVHNIRKRYLSGLYGAIPSVERFSL
jgi:uncharacterized protein